MNLGLSAHQDDCTQLSSTFDQSCEHLTLFDSWCRYLHVGFLWEFLIDICLESNDYELGVDYGDILLFMAKEKLVSIVT